MALALERRGRARPARLRRWLGGLGALLLAAAALASAAFVQPLTGVAANRSPATRGAPLAASAATPGEWRRSPTPTPGAVEAASAPVRPTDPSPRPRSSSGR